MKAEREKSDEIDKRKLINLSCNSNVFTCAEPQRAEMAELQASQWQAGGRTDCLSPKGERETA